MEYKNAADLMPQDLLVEIQKYVSGGLIYIPQLDKNRKEWGARTGIKKELSRRNYEIRQKFLMGVTLSELVEEYCLAFETVKRIVYTKIK